MDDRSELRKIDLFRRIPKVFFGEFRVSILRSILARPFGRVLISTHSSLKGRGKIDFTFPGFLHIGTLFNGITSSADHTLIRLDGRLQLGGSVRVGKGARWHVLKNATLRLGKGTYVSPFSTIIATREITIGEMCAIGWRAEILDSSFHATGENTKATAVHIGDHVWIGAGAIILPGVEIPGGCIVAAGSIVTKSVSESNVLLAGSPARIVKRDVSWA